MPHSNPLYQKYGHNSFIYQYDNGERDKMTKHVITISLILVFITIAVGGLSASQYDKYKKDFEEAKGLITQYEAENAELIEYLDAANSGDRARWDKARLLPAVIRSMIFNAGETEIDTVKDALNRNNSLISVYKRAASVAQHKMDIYYNAYILQDMEAINLILNNGYRSIPDDISDNIYYAWPYTILPEGLLTDKTVLSMNTGNVYLTPATIVNQVSESTYTVNIDGIRSYAIIKNDYVSVGETVNIYFTPFIMDHESVAHIIVGESEKGIDSYHALFQDEKESQ